MWTNDKVLSFIEDLRTNECLWNVTSKDYRNRGKKKDVLEYLSSKYESSISDVEKKMLNLKCQFRREHKKVLTSRKSGSSSKKVSWFAYDALLFLVQQVEVKGSSCAIDDGRSSVNDKIEENSVEEETPVYETRSSCEETPHEEIVEEPDLKVTRGCDQQPKVVTGKKRTRSTDDESETVKCLKTLTEMAARRDKFSVYGEHIANQLRHSGKSHTEITIAQHHMENICFNLVMGVYREESRRYDVSRAGHWTSIQPPSPSELDDTT